MKKSVLFLVTSPRDTELFRILSATSTLTVGYIDCPAPKDVPFKTIAIKRTHTSIFGTFWSGLDTLRSILAKKPLVVIPHIALPQRINTLVKRAISPDSLIIWSDFVPDFYQKKAYKQYFSALGFFFRALKSNFVVASSLESKKALTRIGFPQNGQKLRIIPHTVDAELVPVQHQSPFTIGVYADFLHPAEIKAVIRAFSLYKSPSISLVLLIGDKGPAEALTIQTKQDDRVRIVVSTPRSSKQLPALSALLVPSHRNENCNVIRTAAMQGIPSICPAELPGASLMRSFKKRTYLHGLSAVYLTKAITDVHALYKKAVAWERACRAMQFRAKNSTIEESVRRWKEVLSL